MALNTNSLYQSLRRGRDWSQIVFQDPYYQNLSAFLSSQSAADAADRARLVQQALIEFGFIPDIPSWANQQLWSQDVNDLTRQLAAQATQSGLSTYARLQKAHELAVRDIKRYLGARGMLNSGELPYQLGEEALAYKQQMNDAMNRLSDQLYNVYQAWSRAEAERRYDLANAAMEAAQRRWGDRWNRYYNPTFS